MKHFAYRTKGAGPTDTMGARIKVRQMGLKRLTTVPYDYAINVCQNHVQAAIKAHRRVEEGDLEILETRDMQMGYLIIGVVR